MYLASALKVYNNIVSMTIIEWVKDRIQFHG
jgi:hypothetical protein